MRKACYLRVFWHEFTLSCHKNAGLRKTNFALKMDFGTSCTEIASLRYKNKKPFCVFGEYAALSVLLATQTIKTLFSNA